MSHWSENYLGIPYAERGRSREGVDCWGLAWLIYRDIGITLTSYARNYASAEERAEIAGLIDGAKPDWHYIGIVREYDLLTFRRGRHESHIGIVVKPGLMLHVTQARPVCIENYGEDHWISRFTGSWRHKRMLRGPIPSAHCGSKA